MAHVVAPLAENRYSNELLLYGCAPVPFFGDILKARVATMGLNPSDREFFTSGGGELDGRSRRFPTLRSLRRNTWAECDGADLLDMFRSCRHYFRRNPYMQWFGTLDALFATRSMSYFGDSPELCHLDLVPYATRAKWGDISEQVRRGLAADTAAGLGRFIRDSWIDAIAVNGRAALKSLSSVSDVEFDILEIRNWRLPRRGSPSVPGLSFQGQISRVGSVELGRAVRVVGWNHNLQSSYGVSADVRGSIAHWLGRSL